MLFSLQEDMQQIVGKEVEDIRTGKGLLTDRRAGNQRITAWIPRFSFLASGFVTAFTFATITVFADETAGGGTIFDMAKTAMQKVYNDVVGIATMAAVVCAAVCLFLMYFSKNGRTVDESRAWLKRIIVCWAVLMTLGAIANYFEVLVPQSNFGG